MIQIYNPADLLIISPLVALFLASIIPISVKAYRGREMDHFGSLVWAIAGIIVSAALNISLVNGYLKISNLNFMTAFSGALVVDGIGVWSAYIIYIITGFVMMLLYENKATRDFQFSEHIFLILNSALGMVLVTMSNNLIITFIAIEIMSLSLYLLIALSKERILSKEASFKYFVLGGVGSAIFLYGISFIYGTVGATGLQEIGLQAANLFATEKLFAVGLALVICGMAFKISMVPFHGWAPDVYQGSATPVTTFMAAGVKLAGFIGLLRIFMYAETIQSLQVSNLMQWLAAITMIGGSLAALRQENVKRMLAYSSIAHSGYAMMGLVAASFGTSSEGGTISLLFYLLSYSLMTIGTFAVVSVLEAKEDSILLMDDLRGLGKKYPMLAFSMTLLLLSMAGIPPLLGFFGKFYLLMAAMDQGFYWMAIMAVVATAMGVYFYLRPIVLMYMSEGGQVTVDRNTYLSQSVALVMAMAVLIFGIFSSPLYSFVRNSVLNSL
jgi:NADH-quinone oxidoreductase subunit N